MNKKSFWRTLSWKKMSDGINSLMPFLDRRQRKRQKDQKSWKKILQKNEICCRPEVSVKNLRRCGCNRTVTHGDRDWSRWCCRLPSECRRGIGLPLSHTHTHAPHTHTHAPHTHTHARTTISIQILKISIFNLPLKENVSVFFLYLLLLSLVFSVLRQDFVSMGRWLSVSVSVSGWPGSSDDRKCRASSFLCSVFVGVIDWKSNLERNRNNVGNFLLCVCPVIGQSFPTWLIWCHYNGKDWVPTVISAGIEIRIEIVVVIRADIGAGLINELAFTPLLADCFQQWPLTTLSSDLLVMQTWTGVALRVRLEPS